MRKGKVMLTGWVAPVYRDAARHRAKVLGLTFSDYVERLVRLDAGPVIDVWAAADRIAGRTADFEPPGREYTVGDALGLNRTRECSSCGYAPCMCDQQ